MICEKLNKIATGETKRLVILLPPRHSKSMTVTETFPSFFIGNNPHKRIIAVSYSSSLAKSFGRANKEKLWEFGEPLFGVKIPHDAASAIDWGLTGSRGGMLSTGIGGGITGRGADCLILDDPIKNRQEAESKVYRERLWHEWQNTLIPRLQPNGAVIIILTRWHEDDLVGRLLETEPENWDVLALPAEAEEKDVLGRKPGDPLWPEFGFDREWIKTRKEEVGSQAWNALYQQRPAPASGEIFQRHFWRFWCYPQQKGKLKEITFGTSKGYVSIEGEPAPDDFEQVIQSWDMSFKDGVEGSYVVGQVWGRKGANRYLLDQLRAKLTFTETLRAVEELSAKWPEAHAKLVEDRANGPAVINTLKERISGLIAVNPQGGKEVRSYAVSPQVESGNVYLPHPVNSPWVWDFIEETVTFPHGASDDQVDAMTQALNWMKAQARPTVIRARSIRRA